MWPWPLGLVSSSETKAVMPASQGWGFTERVLCILVLNVCQGCYKGSGPCSPLTVCVSHSHCRQNHSKPSHSMVEAWSGSPAPPYTPNHKFVATDQGKNFPPGKRASAWGRGHWMGALGEF